MPAPSSYANPSTRVSDAERAEVADRLSRHYSDGRLDQEEFSKRLDQAMGAVTQSDLSGLFADLPDLDAQSPGAPKQRQARLASGEPARTEPADTSAGRRTRRHRGSYQRIIGLVLIVIVAIAVGPILARLLIPVLLIALLVVAWRHYGPAHRRRS